MSQYVRASDINKFYEGLGYDLKKIFGHFDKPIFNNVYFNNLTSLREKSDYIEFNKDYWVMRPHVFCKDQYKPYYQYFYPIIMYVNNISTIFHFKPEYFPSRIIIAPKLNEIIKTLTYSEEII